MFRASLIFFVIISLLMPLPTFWGIVFADTTSALRPTADGGDDSANWKNTAKVKCDASDCYLEVDESSGSSCANSDGDTSYIQGETEGGNQTFDIDESSIPDDSIITQIAITVCYSNGGGSTGQFQTRRCVDGACANSGTDINTGADYAEITQSHNGLNITKTASTDIEIGASFTGATGERVRISQISAVLTYTAPEEPEPDPSVTPSGGGGGSAPTSVVFSGQAYPGCKIEVLRKSLKDEMYRNVPVETSLIEPNGAFYFNYHALLMGEYFFALRAEDKDGNKTGILSFNANLLSTDKLIAEDIFVPPTVNFDKATLTKGEDVKISGYAAPDSSIEIKIDDIINGGAQANEEGQWSFTASTTDLKIGEHYVKAQQTSSSTPFKTSNFSFPRAFKISSLTYPKADFNNDNTVNITDWSVFLFRWGSEDKTLKPKIDMDDSGKIDIADFSIFLKSMKI